MPAVGFAMLLKIMFKINYAPFFAIGFVLVAYLQLPILAVAVIGVSIAAYDYFINKGGDGEAKPAPAAAAASAKKEEDYSNGI
jgi:PTS system N-acetylgalactosamine-specific IIC component